MRKFAILFAWHYNRKSAEREISERIAKAAKKLNIECILADVFGRTLDKDYNPTNLFLDEIEGLEFVLHIHFTSSKYQDYFSIYPLWCPPSFLFHWKEYDVMVDNLKTHDDYFTGLGVLAESHIKSINFDSKKNLNDFLPLLPTSTEDTIRKSKLMDIDELKVFYVGSGWEKAAKEPFRHSVILKGLDQSGLIEIYGPEKLSYYSPWEDFKTYKGELPFNAEEIFKKINNCGIVLAISSLEHRKSGILTTRVYEGIVSGAVVITDNSDIVKKLFGNNVLMVDNFGDQEETLKQIKEKISWIKENKEQSFKMVENLQKLFVEKFSLEKQLKYIFDNLESRKKQNALNYYSKKQDIIDIIIKWISPDLNNIEKIIKNINKQIYKNFNKIFICDISLVELANRIFKEASFEVKIIGMNLFDNSLNKQRLATTGEMIQKAVPHLKGKYISFMTNDDNWFSDHITILKRFLDDDDSLNLSYSGFSTKTIKEDKDISYQREFYKKYTFDDFNILNTRFSDGSLLLRSSYYADKLSVLTLIDNLEFHYFLIFVLNEKKYKFSDKITFIKDYYLNNTNYSESFIISEDKQKLFMNSIIPN